MHVIFGRSAISRFGHVSDFPYHMYIHTPYGEQAFQVIARNALKQESEDDMCALVSRRERSE